MVSQAIKQSESSVWYREPWAWFVLTPLIVVVIVSLSFVAVAVKHADDRVVDNYYKEGRMINQSLEQDTRAANWQLSADLHWLADAQVMEVVLHSPMIPAPAELSLWLDHPFDEKQDAQLILQPVSDNRYRTDTVAREHMWYATLVPGTDESARRDSPWRLRGEIDFDRAAHWRFAPTPAAQSSINE
ncbi:FixH family protein [Gilvimarinus algae]|uniref:FixH family protein n=1 Tax=Gilvimarinus algae TaxID=3058037 RepID=A0ABT8TCM2_9GAMM|nr:FixH family protein [Gilvimarinus sp. SDUM040014]MDO3381856.1 FixH family protein [Gilvimarinus sp. SDUM040014]